MRGVALVSLAAALICAPTEVSAHSAEECDIYTSANGAAVNVVTIAVYRIGVVTAGTCYAPESTRAEPPLTCVVDAQVLGELAVPTVLTGAGSAFAVESGDFCEAHGRIAASFEDCTLWSVNGRYFRAAIPVGQALNQLERACAP